MICSGSEDVDADLAEAAVVTADVVASADLVVVVRADVFVVLAFVVLAFVVTVRVVTLGTVRVTGR